MQKLTLSLSFSLSWWNRTKPVPKNMSVSINPLLGFNSKKFQATYMQGSRYLTQASSLKETQFISMSWWSRSGRENRALRLAVADRDQVAVDSSDKRSSNADKSVAKTDNPTTSVAKNSQSEIAPNNSAPIPTNDSNGSASSTQSTPKRSPLTARERLRAARVLSRYTETKPSKSDMGSKVLEALKESDRGKKRSRLPEAPTNLFDDSKRGLPKEGFTFQFPGGVDLFFIIFSFVFISTVMFATTYLVWKVGAIHFNEY